MAVILRPCDKMFNAGKAFRRTEKSISRPRTIVANLTADPRVGNVAGNFYVDDTCIDCDVCRWMTPAVFERVQGKSSVVRQPQDESTRVSAIQATLSCPTCASFVCVCI